MREAVLNLEYLEFLEFCILPPPFSFLVSWLLFYPAHLRCVVEPPQLSPTAAPLTTSQIRCLDNNSSPLLPHEIPKPYPHLPCLNHWLQSAPVCQSVPVAACFSMPGCVTRCLAALAFALHCFWLPQLLFLLSEVVPPQLCAAATTHPASLQVHSLLRCAAVHPVRCGYCVRCVPC